MDTLPLLTDISAIADADLEERDHHNAFPVAVARYILLIASIKQSNISILSKDLAIITGACPFIKEAT